MKEMKLKCINKLLMKFHTVIISRISVHGGKAWHENGRNVWLSILQLICNPSSVQNCTLVIR